MRRFAEPVGVRGQGGVDSDLECGVGGVAAHRKGLILDLAPDRFDRIEFGALGRQEAERNARRLQVRERVLDRTAVVHRRVVQDHDPRTRASRAGRRDAVTVGDLADEREVGHRVVAPIRLAPGGEVQARPGRIVGGQRADHIDPPALGRLVRHHHPLAAPAPGGARRQRRREATLVEEDEVDHAGHGLFLSAANSATFASYASGSRRLWATEVTVRFQPKRRAWRSRLRWSG